MVKNNVRLNELAENVKKYFDRFPKEVPENKQTCASMLDDMLHGCNDGGFAKELFILLNHIDQEYRD